MGAAATHFFDLVAGTARAVLDGKIRSRAGFALSPCPAARRHVDRLLDIGALVGEVPAQRGMGGGSTRNPGHQAVIGRRRLRVVHGGVGQETTTSRGFDPHELWGVILSSGV